MASPSSRFGPYELIATLGRGGMGEVWRARDPRLDRDVAVKISAQRFSDRFQREARTIAALNHPNVCTLFDVGPNYLVMELVEGPTLGERIRQGALPLEEALPLALQIAVALEAAHEKGIVHRDLKPENIKLTPAGTIKVLDFGLAKAVSSESTENLAEAGTLSSPATLAGTILGTPAYMAPEQACGQAVDRRADIWAFGVVLYEMLAGVRPFTGATVTETLAAVLRAEPDFDALPAAVEPGLRSIIARCLRKNQRERWQAIGDVRLLLAEPRAEPAGAPPAPHWGWRALWLAPTAMAVAAAGATGMWLWRPPAPKPVVRFSIPLPADQSITTANGGLAISPDGWTVAYTAMSGNNRNLYLYRLDQGAATEVEGSSDATAPYFSPDNRWIGFSAQGKLWRAAVAGGAPTEICACGGHGTWSADGFIYLETHQQIRRVRAEGGTPEALSATNARWPHALPDGRGLLLAATGTTTPNYGDDYTIEASDGAAHGSTAILLQGGTAPQYLSSGFLLFARQGNLLAAPMDLGHRRLTGTPSTMVNGIEQGVAGMAAYAVSTTGTLVYVNGGEFGTEMVLQAEWLDARGQAQPLAIAPSFMIDPALSPDGGHIAVSAQEGVQNREIWILDLGRGTFSRASFSGPSDIPTHPAWTPDGNRVLFQVYGSLAERLIARQADGLGSDDVLYSTRDVLGSFAVMPDGRSLIFDIGRDPARLEVLPLEGERKPRALLASAYNIVTPAVSPDSRWLAYASDETGRFEIYVQPLPGLQGKWQISVGGGREPCWSHDGRHLYFVGDDAMMEAAVAPTAEGGFSAGMPRPLFRLDGLSLSGGDIFGRSYDVAADGRFLMLKRSAQPANSHQLHVVLNWSQLLKAH